MQSYPCAERLTLVEQVHGCDVADPYRRLEDPTATQTQRWLRDQDELWLTICAATDVWLADLTVDAPPRHLPQDATTIMSVGPDGRLYVVTTQDAPTGRICVGDPTEPTVWHDYIRPNAPLTGLAILDDVVLMSTTSDIALHDRDTGRLHTTLDLPGHGSVGSLSGHGNRAWLSYTDSVTPPTIYCYDASTDRTTAWGGPGAGEHAAETHRLSYNAADGTARELRLIGGPGPRPTILYGYGGFGQSLTPTYSAFALAWVEAGGSFVTATVRGDGTAHHTDMVRYELSGLGERWTAEYGTVQDADDFKNLLSYSPYHRVADGVKYPAVLLTAFGNDTRVDPLHARKLCAALQHATASSRPVLLRFEPDAGHTTGGVNLAADLLAFIADQTGLDR